MMRKAGEDIKLVEFKNRLNKITCDVLIVVEFGDTPMEVQLALEHDPTLFEISHRMYELLRSNIFSPITLLLDEFQRTGSKFLAKMGHYLFTHPQGALSLSSVMMPNSSVWVKEYRQLNQFFNLDSHPN
jgi:hypothetical protein